ncbi:hypothetical protein D3C87_1203250 [compost metagenome]
MQCRQDVFALQHEGIGLGDFVENPYIELHHPGVTGEQISGARQRIADRRGETGDAISLQCRVAA